MYMYMYLSAIIEHETFLMIHTICHDMFVMKHFCHDVYNYVNYGLYLVYLS